MRGCDFPGCPNPHEGHGYCAGHRWQQKKGKELTPLRNQDSKRGCAFPGCPNPHAAHGYCSGHLQQRRKGKDLTPLRGINQSGICDEPYCPNPCRGNQTRCHKHLQRDKVGLDAVGRDRYRALDEWMFREVAAMRLLEPRPDGALVGPHIRFPGGHVKKDSGHAPSPISGIDAHRLIFKRVFPDKNIDDLDLDHDPSCPKDCVQAHHLTPLSKGDHSTLEHDRRGHRYTPRGLSRNEALEFKRRIRREARKKKRMIFERDQGVCYLCDKTVSYENCHLEHIIPIWARHPRLDFNADCNLAVAHPPCHVLKERHTKTFLKPCPSEFGIDLPPTKKELYQATCNSILSLAPRYHTGELTIRAIRKMVAASHETVVKVFREAGIPIRNKSESKKCANAWRSFVANGAVVS